MLLARCGQAGRGPPPLLQAEDGVPTAGRQLQHGAALRQHRLVHGVLAAKRDYRRGECCRVAHHLRLLPRVSAARASASGKPVQAAHADCMPACEACGGQESSNTTSLHCSGQRALLVCDARPVPRLQRHLLSAWHDLGAGRRSIAGQVRRGTRSGCRGAHRLDVSDGLWIHHFRGRESHASVPVGYLDLPRGVGWHRRARRRST